MAGTVAGSGVDGAFWAAFGVAAGFAALVGVAGDCTGAAGNDDTGGGEGAGAVAEAGACGVDNCSAAVCF